MHLKFCLACRLSPKIDGFWERSVRGRHSCWTLLALVVFFSVLALVGYKYGRDAAAKVAAFFSLPSVFEGVFVPIIFLVCTALWYVYDQVKCAYAEFRDGWRRSTTLPQCIDGAAAACTSPRQWAKKRSKLTRFFMSFCVLFVVICLIWSWGHGAREPSTAPVHKDTDDNQRGSAVGTK